MVVRFRKDLLALVYAILLIVLLFINWVGFRERQEIVSFPFLDTQAIAIGDLDPYHIGQELTILTPSQIALVYDSSQAPIPNHIYDHPNWDVNPLVAFAVGDFDTLRKGDEIMTVTLDGDIILLRRFVDAWHHSILGNLPSPSPVWTTRSVAAGQVDRSSISDEFVIAGKYFDWTAQNATGRVYVVGLKNNTDWEVDEIYIDLEPFLSGTIGDVNREHPGLEIVVGGETGRVISIELYNGSVSTTLIFSLYLPVHSLSVGKILTQAHGYQIGVIASQDGFILRQFDSVWVRLRILSSQESEIELQSISAGDADPYRPGDELIALGRNPVNGNFLLILFEDVSQTWIPNVYWNFLRPPVALRLANIDFNREGAEIISASESLISILGIPSGSDRFARAGSAVLIPAAILFPATVVIFASAAGIQKVANRRRRNYARYMVARGFVRCPKCKRFVPRNRLKAHLRYHQLYLR